MGLVRQIKRMRRRENHESISRLLGVGNIDNYKKTEQWLYKLNALKSYLDKLKTEYAEIEEQAEGIAIKYDKDKPRLDLVPPGIIEAVGVIRTYGTKKYKDSKNWRNVEPERYTAALMRHLCKFLRDPQGVDEESGYPHLWHMACNIAFLIELERGREQK